MGIGARHHDLARLKWLTKAVEGLDAEFWQLVEKQDAIMGQGHFAGLGPDPAAG